MTIPNSVGPRTEFADYQHAKKYRSPGEDFRDAMNRIANALKDDEEHYHAFRAVLKDMRFLPAGRVQAAMGQSKNVTAFNCFVSGTIEDSFVDGQGSIMQRATQAANTMRMGGGIGYDFSTLRPRGEMIKKLGSRATGPVSFMGIYNEIGLCTSSTDHRRGAQMGVLRVDHPDIREFLHAKQNGQRLTGFNISIGITDAFMKAVLSGGEFNLEWGGRVYDTVDARSLWDEIMRSTWDWAEPGVLFVDTINRDNNLHYCETIAATNPCGEQPLPPFGACLLGSFNLVKYLVPAALRAVEDVGVIHAEYTIGGGWTFDFDMLRADIEPVVRAMDNIIDRTVYPLYEQEKEAKAKRRMGLGVTGAANAIEALGYPYGSDGFCRTLQEILGVIRDESYRTSAMLAGEKEKGPFPLFSLADFQLSAMWPRLPQDVRELIVRNGLRNSHLTSIAPTGTISLCADNVSSGIEPVYAYSVKRTYQTFEGPQEVMLEDYGYAFLGVKGRRTRDLGVAEHLAVLKACVPYVDSAISKTVNVEGSVSWEDFQDVYVQMWRAGVKGGTTFRKDGKRFGIMKDEDDAGEDTLILSQEAEACYIDPHTGQRSCGE